MCMMRLISHSFFALLLLAGQGQCCLASGVAGGPHESTAATGTHPAMAAHAAHHAGRQGATPPAPCCLDTVPSAEPGCAACAVAQALDLDASLSAVVPLFKSAIGPAADVSVLPFAAPAALMFPVHSTPRPLRARHRLFSRPRE